MYEQQGQRLSDQCANGIWDNNIKKTAGPLQAIDPRYLGEQAYGPGTTTSRPELPTGFRDLHAREARERSESMRNAIEAIRVAAEGGFVETEIYGDAFVIDQLIHRGY